jgi:hypothetical protein
MENKIQETIKEITEMGYKPIVLNESQVAKVIGVSPSTIANWRKVGLGPEFKKLNNGLKAKVMYTKHSVAEWLCDLQKTA